MANIKISELPLKIGSAGISTGYVPISIGSITYKVNPSQLNLFALNPNSVVITDGSSQLASSLVSSTELFALKDISGNVQTQINNVVSSLSAFSKSSVTGGTHNTSAGTTTFRNSTGGTFQVSGYVTFDTSMTGGTYNNSNGIATFTNNSGGTFAVTGFNTGYTYTPENVANKQNSYTFDGTAKKYPTVDAANNVMRSLLKVAARTGLMHKYDNFNMTVLDNSTIRILSADTIYYQYEGLTQPSPTTAIKSFPQRDYPLTQLMSGTSGNTNIVPITADGVYVRYLGLDFSGNVVSQPTNFNDNDFIFQMGYTTVLKTGSSVTFLGGTGATARNIYVKPDMACNTEFDRISGINTNVGLAGTATANFKVSAGNVFGISVNYRSFTNPNNTSSIDSFMITGYTGNTPFVSIDPTFATATTGTLTVFTSWTQTVNGIAVNNSFFNTTTGLRDTMNNSTASIKRILMGLKGGIFVQEGEHATAAAYADLTTAKNNIFTQTFTDVIQPTDVIIEIARIAYVKGASNFNDTLQVYIVNTASNGGGSSSSFAAVADATTVSKGIIQLAGDLAGTATAPTVPSLGTKVSGAGSGIANYTAKWLNSTTLTASSVYDAGLPGLIGIGTTNPRNVAGFANITLNGPTGGTFHIRANEIEIGGIAGDNTALFVRTLTGSPVIFQTAGVERARISTSGNTLIGTSSDNLIDKLQVVGSTKLSGSVTYGDSILTTNNLTFTKHLGQYVFTAGTSNQNIDIILGNNSISGHLEITLDSTFQGGNAYGSIIKVFQVGVNPSNSIFHNQGNVVQASTMTTGHFAIGDLYWDSFNSRYAIRISHLSSSLNTISISVRYFNGGAPSINVFNSLALGTEYIQSGATKNYVSFSDNVGIGTSSPSKLLEIVGGDALINGLTVGRGGNNNASNTTFGFSALASNVNGSNIIAIGREALKTSVNGDENIAIGFKVLENSNNSGQNVAIGNRALNWLQAGSSDSNVAIGASVANSLNNISIQLTGASQSVFIGSGIRCGTLNNQINQVVIGANARGNNSNTVTIGDENITDNYFKGKINLGTTANTATLNILTPSIVGRESLFQAMISDNAIDKIMIANGTTVANRFAPGFVGYTEGGYGAIFFRGLGSATDDSTTNTPYVTFLAANTSSSSDPNNGSLTAPSNRPMFSWGSVTTHMQMAASGNLSLGGISNDGINKLQVTGTVRANAYVTAQSSASTDANITVDTKDTGLYYWNANFTANRLILLDNLTNGQKFDLYVDNTNPSNFFNIIVRARVNTSDAYLSARLVVPNVGTTDQFRVNSNSLARMTIHSVNGNFIGSVAN